MRLLLLAVAVAQALDLATFMAMPRVAELNPLAQALHTEAAWLAKALLVVLVVAIQPALRPRYAAVGEAVALIAIAAGCIGAGSNLAVLTAIASETSRSVQEPAPIASDAKGIEQGAQGRPGPDRSSRNGADG